MKLLFHKAPPQHTAPLAALQRVCTDFLLAKGIHQWTYMSEGDVIKELPSTYVLLLDHTVVASFCIKPYEKDTAYVTCIAMHPDYQGVGIGKAIYTRLKGYEQPVYLGCWNSNEKLKSFYKENGGHIIGVLPETDCEIRVFYFQKRDRGRNQRYDPSSLKGGRRTSKTDMFPIPAIICISILWG